MWQVTQWRKAGKEPGGGEWRRDQKLRKITSQYIPLSNNSGLPCHPDLCPLKITSSCEMLFCNVFPDCWIWSIHGADHSQHTWCRSFIVHSYFKEVHQFLQFKKRPTFIGDGETASSKASLEQALSFASGVVTEKRTVCSLIFQQITYDDENTLSCC